MSKINDTYLCVQAGCDEVFSLKEQHYFLYNYYPICPICGSKNSLNLGRVLNREEKNDETFDRNTAVRNRGGANSQSIYNSPSGNGEKSSEKQTTDCGNQDRSGRSGREDSDCDSNSLKTNESIAGVTVVADALGILLQHKSRVKQAIPGADADTKEQFAYAQRGGCEYFNRE